MAKRSAVLLTKRVVDSACPDHDRYHIWDSELSGFGLRVSPTGVKTFIIKYRTDGGGRSAAQRVLTRGHFGPITVEQARRVAKAKLGGVAAGADPAEALQIAAIASSTCVYKLGMDCHGHHDRYLWRTIRLR
ncbi:Arm DNA-binding domain-containing protein, partial [Rhizobium sp. WW_1]|uniref:Arm DNA-binding domain-containing protein n=2 Tax=unclassified Rhizobium TaxID=2613769 RepID=UPI000FEEB23A